MRTSPERYAARHAQICQRAELESAAGTTVETLVAAVHRAIDKRDGTDIGAVLAAMAAHVALKEDRRRRGIENVQYAQRPPEAESHSPIPVGA